MSYNVCMYVCMCAMIDWDSVQLGSECRCHVSVYCIYICSTLLRSWTQVFIVQYSRQLEKTERQKSLVVRSDLLYNVDFSKSSKQSALSSA